jgi:peptide/nickel transport system permease protein
VIIGLLDSIHFRFALSSPQNSEKVYYSGEVKSLLDILMGPVGQQNEKSYSAPFATHLYSKVTTQLPDGTLVSQYPKLHYAGVHLKNPADKAKDIIIRIVIGAISALVIWLITCFIWIFFLSRKNHENFNLYLKKIIRGKAFIAWREVLITLGIALQIIFIIAFLAAEYHILGTDKVGRDVFYETIKSIRTGLVIGTLTTLIMLPFAVIFGIMAGYFGNWIDDSVQYVYTTLSSIPAVLLITAVVLSLQIFIENHPNFFPTLALRADIRLLALCVILGITSWTTLCRLLRGETLKLREVDFIAAAIALGTRTSKILTQHILPNVMHIILITVVLDFSALVLAEAVLSYVGVGVDPTTISWGNMINSARLELAREPMVWWPLLAAFLFMFTLVLAANLFADAVRDAFDPRLRNLEQ